MGFKQRLEGNKLSGKLEDEQLNLKTGLGDLLRSFYAEDFKTVGLLIEYQAWFTWENFF